MITEIIDIGKLRAKKYLSDEKRKEELKRMIDCCEITYKSLLDIQDPMRMQFTNMLDRYNMMFKKELERIGG